MKRIGTWAALAVWLGGCAVSADGGDFDEVSSGAEEQSLEEAALPGPAGGGGEAIETPGVLRAPQLDKARANPGDDRSGQPDPVPWAPTRTASGNSKDTR